MQYSNTTTKAGIIQNIERMTDLGDAYISGDATRLAEFTSMVNRISSRVWHNIFMATGNWQYDDSNETNLPIATTNLVSGQQTYALPAEALTIQRLEIKDENGNWEVLRPLVKEKIKIAIDEYNDVDGDPIQYLLVNSQIVLYPAPNYSQDASLKAYYDREAVAFTTSDTTKTPGFASPYHEILPIGASIEWFKVKQPTSPTMQVLMADYQRLEQSIKEYYSKRFKDYKPRVGRLKQRFK
jgi:hypothetical protein